MATYSGENGPDACQQALGVRENVVVESRTCKVPDVIATYDPNHGWPRDPAWAGTDAERLARAMLDNIKPLCRFPTCRFSDVSKETTYESLETSSRRCHGDMTDIAEQR